MRYSKRLTNLYINELKDLLNKHNNSIKVRITHTSRSNLSFYCRIYIGDIDVSFMCAVVLESPYDDIKGVHYTGLGTERSFQMSYDLWLALGFSSQDFYKNVTYRML